MSPSHQTSHRTISCAFVVHRIHTDAPKHTHAHTQTSNKCFQIKFFFYLLSSVWVKNEIKKHTRRETTKKIYITFLCVLMLLLLPHPYIPFYLSQWENKVQLAFFCSISFFFRCHFTHRNRLIFFRKIRFFFAFVFVILSAWRVCVWALHETRAGWWEAHWLANIQQKYCIWYVGRQEFFPNLIKWQTNSFHPERQTYL